MMKLDPRNKRVFIAGPLYGWDKPDSNGYLTRQLKRDGAAIVFDPCSKSMREEKAKSGDEIAFKRVLTRFLLMADALVLKDGWEMSPDATLQRDIAKRCGIPCFEIREVG